jgi:hypothetical protein
MVSDTSHLLWVCSQTSRQ